MCVGGGGGAQMTDTGLQMMGFKLTCSLVTADTTLLYLSIQMSDTRGGGGTYPQSKAVGLDGSYKMSQMCPLFHSVVACIAKSM